MVQEDMWVDTGYCIFILEESQNWKSQLFEEAQVWKYGEKIPH